MADGIEHRGKGIMQDVPHPIDEKTVSFPTEVMVMGNGGDAGFRDIFCDRYAQGDVHGNRQGIFRDEEIDIKVSAKLI